MAQIQWLNANNGSFSDPADWNTGTVPATADDAVIDAAPSSYGGGNNFYVVTDDITDTVQSLEVNYYQAELQVGTSVGSGITLTATQSITNETGSIVVLGGNTLRIGNGGTYTQQLNGSLTRIDGTLDAADAVNDGIVFEGGGDVTGLLDNAGTVIPGDGLTAGTLSVGGFTQESAGHLQVALDGAAAGQTDVIASAGSLALGGTLDIQQNLGTVANGESFTIATFKPGALTGTFALLTDGRSVGTPDWVYAGNGEFLFANYDNADGKVTLTASNVAPVNLAVPVLAPGSIDFGEVHVGDAINPVPITITNGATVSAALPNDSLEVDATLNGSGDASPNGSVTGLAPGASNGTNVTVGFNDFAPGVGDGNALFDLFSNGTTTAHSYLGQGTVVVTGTVFQEASLARINNASTIVHVGDAAPSYSFDLANAAPAGGFSENLDVSSITNSGAGTLSGVAAPLTVAPNASSGPVTIAMNTGTAGVFDNTVTIVAVSDGSGIDTLGTTALGTTDVFYDVTVDNYATAEFDLVGNGGRAGIAITGTPGTAEVLNLGTIHSGGGTLDFKLAGLNAAAGQADQLTGTIGGANAGPFTLSGFGDVGTLDAGAVGPAGDVFLDTTNTGTYAETLTFTGTGSNASGYAAALPTTTLTVEAVISAIACYAAGTRLATPAGEVAVEHLRAGDRVTVIGGHAHVARPVRWVGRRGIDLARHANPDLVRPIRIRRNAIAEGAPIRDLIVSPDHALWIDGRLIPARLLVNGVSVTVAEDISCVEYFHVELDRHALLLAEGLPAESYLDTGNRAAFADIGATADPDFSVETAQARWTPDALAPLTTDAATVRPIWTRLAARAATLGPACEALAA